MVHPYDYKIKKAVHVVARFSFSIYKKLTLTKFTPFPTKFQALWFCL